MCRPKTRSLPIAATHRAATTLESMPPDSATIVPLPLRSVEVAVSEALIRATSASASMREHSMSPWLSTWLPNRLPLWTVVMRCSSRAGPGRRRSSGRCCVVARRPGVGDETAGGCSWVETTASRRMLSVLPCSYAAGAGGLGDQPGHRPRVEDPGRGEGLGRGDLVEPLRRPAPRRSWRRPGRGRAAWAGGRISLGDDVGEGPLQQVLLLEPEELVPRRQRVGELDDLPVEEREPPLDRVAPSASGRPGRTGCSPAGASSSPATGRGQRVPVLAAGRHRATDVRGPRSSSARRSGASIALTALRRVPPRAVGDGGVVGSRSRPKKLRAKAGAVPGMRAIHG